MDSMEHAIELYRGLPPEKRDFVLAVFRWAEGYWGDLKYEDTRKFYYLVLHHGVSPTFSRAFKRNMEARWKDAKENTADATGFEGEPLSDHERSSWAAEDAFRDFNYAYEDAFKCNQCGEEAPGGELSTDGSGMWCSDCRSQFRN